MQSCSGPFDIHTFDVLVNALSIVFVSASFDQRDAEISRFPIPASGARIVLATDGLWDRVEPETVANLALEEAEPQATAMRLMKTEAVDDGHSLVDAASQALVANVVGEPETSYSGREFRHRHGYFEAGLQRDFVLRAVHKHHMLRLV